MVQRVRPDMKRTLVAVFTFVGLFSLGCDGNGRGPTSPSSGLVVGTTGDFAKIGDAINAARPGDTIRVLPGTYAERVVIDKPGLTLVAERAIVDGLAGGLDGTGFGIHVLGVNGVEIAGFVVQNFEVGIALEHARGSRIRENETRNNLDKQPPNNFWEGIRLIASDDNEIRDNFSHRNGDSSLTLSDGSSRNVIRGNRLNDNGPQAGNGTCGILFLGGANNNNQIVNNEMLRNGWGILFNPISASSGNIISGNRLHEGPRAGIALRGQSGGNVIEDNDVTGNGVQNVAPSFGFDLFDDSTGSGNIWRRNSGRANF